MKVTKQLKVTIQASDPDKNHGHGEGDTEILFRSVDRYPDLVLLEFSNGSRLEMTRKDLIDAALLFKRKT